MYAIMRDDVALAGLPADDVTIPAEDEAFKLGEHDAVGDVPHIHWSILTLSEDEGIHTVENLDWGYHSPEEAAEVAKSYRGESHPRSGCVEALSDCCRGG